MPGKLIVADNLEWLAGQKDKSIDFVVCDPPWNQGKRYGKNRDRLARAQYEFWAALIVSECERIARRGTAWVLPARLFPIFWRHIPHADLITIQKKAHGVFQGNFRRQTFGVLVTAPPILDNLEKGRRDPRLADMWIDIRLPGEGYLFYEERPDHPAFTARAIVRRLLELFTMPFDTVVDPCMGSGTTALECERLGRNWIGVDQEPAFLREAITRLDAAGFKRAIIERKKTERVLAR